MELNINRLRELIRTGEYLSEHYNDNSVLYQWIFDVAIFCKDIDRDSRNMIESTMHTLRNMPSDYIYNKDNQKKVLAFLISIYNNNSLQNKHISKDAQSIFIIHGHNNDIIEKVKETIVVAGYKPVVLREQADNGATIIEKLEEWLGNCKCAIVLYTPCDIGKANNEDEYEERARQNVVYEHGLFQGYLGRNRILILKHGKTALPSDCAGIVYTSIDDVKWKEHLIKNIEAIDRQ